MGIENQGKKIPAVGAMKKRNKRTEIKAHEQLAALTERILSQMGEEGAVIRRRLQLFYRRRASRNHAPGDPQFDAANGDSPRVGTRARQ